MIDQMANFLKQTRSRQTENVRDDAVLDAVIAASGEEGVPRLNWRAELREVDRELRQSEIARRSSPFADVLARKARERNRLIHTG